MAKKSNRKIAAELYLAGLQMKDIANILDLSPQTLTRYAKDGDWKNRRAEREMMEMSVFDISLEILHYQATAIKAKKDEWIDNGKKNKLIEKGDIDAFQKLHTTIRRDLTQLEHYIKAMNEFVIFLKDKDLSLAKQILTFQSEFLEGKQKQYGI